MDSGETHSDSEREVRQPRLMSSSSAASGQAAPSEPIAEEEGEVSAEVEG